MHHISQWELLFFNICLNNNLLPKEVKYVVVEEAVVYDYEIIWSNINLCEVVCLVVVGGVVVGVCQRSVRRAKCDCFTIVTETLSQ